MTDVEVPRAWDLDAAPELAAVALLANSAQLAVRAMSVAWPELHRPTPDDPAYERTPTHDARSTEARQTAARLRDLADEAAELAARYVKLTSIPF